MGTSNPTAAIGNTNCEPIPPNTNAAATVQLRYAAQHRKANRFAAQLVDRQLRIGHQAMLLRIT